MGLLVVTSGGRASCICWIASTSRCSPWRRILVWTTSKALLMRTPEAAWPRNREGFSGLIAYLARARALLCEKERRTAADRPAALACASQGGEAVQGPSGMNVFQKLRDIYLNIDRCLDIGDLRGFSRASHQLREVLSRLRDHIGNTSLDDIAAREAPVRHP